MTKDEVVENEVAELVGKHEAEFEKEIAAQLHAILREDRTIKMHQNALADLQRQLKEMQFEPLDVSALKQ